MSNVQLTAVHRTDEKNRSTDELVFESSQGGNTSQAASDQQEYTVPGQLDEEHQYSIIGSGVARQGSSRKEAQNYLYGKIQPNETPRHPTIAQQHSSQSVETVESIAKTRTCGCTTGQFCMYFFICILMLLGIAGITIAVLAWQGVGTDDCSCNGSLSSPSTTTQESCTDERIQELENLLNSISSTNQNLSQELDSAMETISNLTELFETLNGANASELGPQGPPGPQGEPGFNGTVGMPGMIGSLGPQGVNGSTGPIGPPGHNGSSPNVTGVNLYENCNKTSINCTDSPSMNPGSPTSDLSCSTASLPAPSGIQVFGRRCVVTTTGNSENVASYIRVDNNGGESCVCTLVQGMATSITCTFYRTECPLLQNLTIN